MAVHSLVDNQARNGQWSYGKEVPLDKDVPTTTVAPDVATGPAAVAPHKAAPKKKGPLITIRRRQKAAADAGDHSNSQYAALGLRACIEANVMPPLPAPRHSSASEGRHRQVAGIIAG